MNQDLIFEQAAQITKSYAYDNVALPKIKALQEENEALKKDVEIWKDLALKYREMVKEHEKNIKEILNR